MKTTAFFATAILFLGFGPQVFSQDYPMPAPGARWGMYYTDDFGAAYGILHSYTFTDTVINGTQYINWSHGFFLTRYDSQKVFRYNVSAKKEFCIYDFSLNLDDSIYLSPSYFSERDSILLYVKDVSTIKLKNGQTRKVMHLKTKDNADDFIGNIVEYWWIEGIGDMDQGFFYAKPFGMVQESFYRLICYSDASGLVYQKWAGVTCDNILQLYPTGAAESAAENVFAFIDNERILHISSERMLRSVTLTDASGRTVLKQKDKSMNLADVATGIYVLSVSLDDGSVYSTSVAVP